LIVELRRTNSNHQIGLEFRCDPGARIADDVVDIIVRYVDVLDISHSEGEAVKMTLI
jgi:hypothetical protein